MNNIFNFGLLKHLIYLQLVVFIFNRESKKREEIVASSIKLGFIEGTLLLEDFRNGSTKVSVLVCTGELICIGLIIFLLWRSKFWINALFLIHEFVHKASYLLEIFGGHEI